MSETYLHIQKKYLQKAWARPLEELQACLKAQHKGGCFHFQAFGESCVLCGEEIILDGEAATDPRGILIALYAVHVPNRKVQLQPLKSFKELPNSMPYQAAFASNAEQPLVSHVAAIQDEQDKILSLFSGHANPDAPTGDFSFTLYPLPFIPLYCIFHLPDDEFPASVTCLFASNASDFMPLDGLADVAEYTAKKMISIV